MARANEEDDGVEYGVTFFADLTEDEAQQYYGFNSNITAPAPEEEAPRSDLIGADSADHKHRFGAAKNQGNCGSCWAFTAVAVLEGWSHIKAEKIISLSEQQVLDCSGDYNSCNGGWYYMALRTIAQNGNHLASGESYPYKPVKGSCKRDSHENALPFKIAEVSQARGDDNVAAQLVNGPVAVAMDFGRIRIRGYYDGIYTPENCGNRPTHAVAVTGYTGDYWEIRNSWGEGWGNKGYFKITRKIPNVCGISNYAYYITVGSQEELE